jgi:hypothetical protein
MLVNLTKEWLKGELEGHLLAWHRSAELSGWFPPPYQLRQVDNPRAARLWLSNALSAEHLNRVRRETRFSELKAYVTETLDLADSLEVRSLGPTE